MIKAKEIEWIDVQQPNDDVLWRGFIDEKPVMEIRKMIGVVVLGLPFWRRGEACMSVEESKQKCQVALNEFVNHIAELA